jgi:hypothetical protein
MSLWQFYHKVDRDRLPLLIWNVERLEFTEGSMPLGLSPKAKIAGAAILTYVLRHLWLPVRSGDKLKCLPSSWVSGDMGVMVLSNDLAMEFSIFRDIDPVLEKD